MMPLLTCTVLVERLLFTALCLFPAAAHAVDPPSKPDYAYISPDFSVHQLGSCVDGSRVYVYQPDTPKPGGADVVVYMHGFAATRPTLYQGHMEHLVQQGNYVLFPQFQPGFCGLGRGLVRGILRRLRRASPAEWFLIAGESVSDALDSLPDGSYNDIYLFGHSLGGAFGMMFGSLGDAFTKPVTAAVLSSPQPGGFEAIPGLVTTIFFFRFGEDIDVPNAAPETNYPVAVLHASDDDVAPLEDVMPSYDALGSSSKAIYQAQTDTYSKPELTADHLLVLSSKRSQDNLDWRYIWSGLDQVMAGVNVTDLSFDMGAWSDGEPVKVVNRID